MKKWIALALTLCMCLSMFAGCRNQNSGPDLSTLPKPEQMEVSSEPTQAPADAPDPNEPSAEELLVYTLTDADLDTFREKLAVCKQAALNNADYDTLDACFEEMDDAYGLLESQQGVASILYCCNEKDEEAKGRHLKSVEMLTDAHDELMLALQEIYYSDSRVKDFVFENWTEEDFAQLESYTSENAELEQQNEETLVAYHVLDEEELRTGIAPYYTSLIANNQKIAQLSGYENYYEYAYKLVYGRDYDTAQVNTVRKYIQEYLVPTSEWALNSFVSRFRRLEPDQQELVVTFMEESSKDLPTDYLEHYAKQLPEGLREDMLHMRRNRRAVFSDHPDARAGAFTMSIDGKPVCFFGPGYDGIMTVTHETGHYCSCLHMDLNALPMDLAELQSQGNEWMMIYYMQNELEPATYRALRDYKMYTDICTILIATMVDDFEQRIYENPNSVNFTDKDFDAVADAVCADYGGKEFIKNYVVDFNYYWRMVTMDSPVYYISYAMSGLAAVSLYTVAMEDPELAYETLAHLIMDAEPELGFQENLEMVNLKGPFHEEVYQKIADLYK